MVNAVEVAEQQVVGSEELANLTPSAASRRIAEAPDNFALFAALRPMARRAAGDAPEGTVAFTRGERADPAVGGPRVARLR